jgi:hypothetical protein
VPRLMVDGSLAEFELSRQTPDSKVRKGSPVTPTDTECDREIIGSSIL